MDLAFDILRGIGLATAAGVLVALVPPRVLAAVLAVVAGVALGGWSVLGEHGVWWLAPILGAAAAYVTFVIGHGFFTRARTRLGDAGIGGLVLYAVVIAVVIVACSVLFPPLALVVIAALVWFGLSARRRSGEKYAGLRILR